MAALAIVEVEWLSEEPPYAGCYAVTKRRAWKVVRADGGAFGRYLLTLALLEGEHAIPAGADVAGIHLGEEA